MRSQRWISRLVDEARIGHVADCRREDAAAAQRAALRCRTLAELRLAVLLDLEGFLAANRDLPQMRVTCDNGRTAQGFIVSRADHGSVTRLLAVELSDGTLDCRYSSGGGGDGSSDQPTLTVQIARDNGSFSLWREGIEQRFASVDIMSAFLLAPMFRES